MGGLLGAGGGCPSLSDGPPHRRGGARLTKPHSMSLFVLPFPETPVTFFQNLTSVFCQAMTHEEKVTPEQSRGWQTHFTTLGAVGRITLANNLFDFMFFQDLNLF